jgi:hypothetical protein
MSSSHQVLPAPQSYLTYLRQAHLHGLIAGDYKYNYEFALLLNALKDLEDNLGNDQYVSYEPLNQILQESARLTYEANQMNTYGDFHSTKLEKIIAIKNTVLKAAQVAKTPFDIEATIALVESAQRTRNVTEGSYVFRKRNQQTLAAFVLATIMLTFIALVAVKVSMPALITLALLFAFNPLFKSAEGRVEQKDFAAESIDKQATILNKNCLFNRDQQQPAQQAPANDHHGIRLES